LKKLLLCFAAGLTALSLGLGIFYAGEFLVSLFQTSEQETAETREIVTIEPEKIPIEDLVYPKAMQTEVSSDRSEGEIFYYGGEYLVIGEIAEGFEDCENLEIETEKYEETAEDNSWKSILIPPNGKFFISDEKHIKFDNIYIANRQIAFQTEIKNGIMYQFTGNFTKTEEIKIGDYTYYSVLEGKLSKIQNGKQIAVTDVNFESLPGC
jgi:hypothetical protein